MRLTTQQAAKFVPIAGQAVSAALTYSALRYVCEQHIQQCVAISQAAAAGRAGSGGAGIGLGRSLATPRPLAAQPAEAGGGAAPPGRYSQPIQPS